MNQVVGLDRLREYMKTQAYEDRNRRSIEVTGETIEAALEQASIELGLPIKMLDYEVLVKGNAGAFGFGRKEYTLLAYEHVELTGRDEGESEGADFEDRDEIVQEVQDRDGEVIVKLYPDGVFIKAVPPVGKGKRVTERDLMDGLSHRGISKIDNDLASKVIKKCDGQYVKIGAFEYNPANDSVVTIDIVEQEMKAVVFLQKPGIGGTDLSASAILSFIKNNNVVHGMNLEVLQNLEDHPVYDRPVTVAEGTRPRNGEDARIEYNFERDRSKIELLEKNGRVDFRELNLVQNVVEGQVLAQKIPAEEGIQGRTVTGKIIPAKGGRDVRFAVGKNVRLSDDGLAVIATINGQVVITNDKINVEPVYVIQGDVNLKTGGNVIFLGTVIVKGSVDDGFKVKASGNIEIFGNVGKSEVDAEGDIIVHQGIAGKGGGAVRSGRGVWAKFIENGNIQSGDLVYATDGIINSRVDADKRIICQGKRATIVGGHLRAAEEISAKSLGSVAGSETVLEVGYDPKNKAKLAQLEERIEKIDTDLEEMNLNINTLENLKKVKRTLPEEKEQYLRDLLESKHDLLEQKNEYLADIQKVHDYLASLKIRGKVSASSKVFPGVRVNIKDAFLEVRNEFSSVTFINEGNIVKVTEYEAPEEDYGKRK